MKQMNKSQKLYEAITDIPSELIENAEKQELKQKNPFFKKYWKGIAAAVLAITVTATAVLLPRETSVSSSAFAIAESSYPEMAPYPDEMSYFDESGSFDSEAFDKDYEAWAEDMQKQRRATGYADGLNDYFYKSMVQFLSETNNESNTVFSPLNVYIALSMLAEVTDGNSRQQILNLLGQNDMDSLRKQASDVWNSTYRKDGAVTSVLANSLWLNEDVTYNEETIQSLADYYYASAFQGKMGSEKYDKALQDWLNAQTGGLLKEQAEQISMDPELVMALASTVYFQAKWQNEYNPDNTEKGTFHTSNGDVTVDYMKTSAMGEYYWSDSFSAIGKKLDTEGSRMWFILPDEGISVEQLLQDKSTLELVLAPYDWNNQKYVLVNEAVPKFDITSQIELSEGLKELGVTDVFDMSSADFSPITEDIAGIFLSKAQHDTRVAIDEEGVTAAAYTVMMMCGSAMPQEEVDFVVDRPFLFMITNPNGLPLFTGVVNQPS